MAVREFVKEIGYHRDRCADRAGRRAGRGVAALARQAHEALTSRSPRTTSGCWATSGCGHGLAVHRRRLNEVEAISGQGVGRGRLPPLGDIGHPPREAWAMLVADGLVSGQTWRICRRTSATALAEAALMPYLPRTRDRTDWSALLRTCSGPGRRRERRRTRSAACAPS